MATPKSVWGIDIGQRALKALKIRLVEGQLQVDAFDVIEHPKILSGDNLESRQHIHNALMQFLSRNSISGSAVAISVPGQASFTRFVKLPPVEKKKIPDIVRFEAEQQIPFTINDVVWRWQTFESPDSPDVEVGIFAVKRDDIAGVISHLTDAGIEVDVVQMAPLSLYNFKTFDRQLAEDGATLLADIGTDKTDIIIADGARIWTRTIQVGGSNFTESIVKAFKLSFDKAEKLKRTAATSKYARQIFQAMRPVFAELVQEIQRSVGYYTSLHRETRFKKLIGLGNGFRLPGLQKYLEQNLNIPVVRIDTYNQLRPSPAVNAPTFAENVPSFPVAYGLAIQGLELAEINTNLLPGKIAHRRLWAKKKPWFAAATAALVIALAMFPYRAGSDRGVLKDSSSINMANSIVKKQQKLQSDLNRGKNLGGEDIEQIKHRMRIFAYRQYWATAFEMLFNSINRVFADLPMIPQYAKYLSVNERTRNNIAGADAAALKAGLKPEELKKLTSLFGVQNADQLAAALKGIRKFASAEHSKRKIAFIENMEVEYFEDAREAEAKLEAMKAGGRSTGQKPTGEMAESSARAFTVVMTVRTPLSKAAANNIFSALKKQTESRAKSLKQLNITKFVLVEVGQAGSRTTGAVRTPAGRRRPAEWDMGEMGERPGYSPARSAAAAEVGPKLPDPLFTGEDMSADIYFNIGWVITIE